MSEIFYGNGVILVKSWVKRMAVVNKRCVYRIGRRGVCSVF